MEGKLRGAQEEEEEEDGVPHAACVVHMPPSCLLGRFLSCLRTTKKPVRNETIIRGRDAGGGVFCLVMITNAKVNGGGGAYYVSCTQVVKLYNVLISFLRHACLEQLLTFPPPLPLPSSWFDERKTPKRRQDCECMIAAPRQRKETQKRKDREKGAVVLSQGMYVYSAVFAIGLFPFTPVGHLVPLPAAARSLQGLSAAILAVRQSGTLVA